MSDNVIDFPGVSYVDVPPEPILKAALKADLASVIVLGWTTDDRLYAAPSMTSVAEILLLVESFKHTLMSAEAE